MQTEEKQMKMSYLIKRFVPYFKKYKWILILDLICASLTTVCELVFPMLVRYITNMGINNIAGLTVGIILKIGLFYLILRIIDSAANFYMADTGHIMGAKIETDMRRDLFAHLETLSHSYFAEHKVGQIMARITSDLFDITEFAHHCPEEFFTIIMRRLMVKIANIIAERNEYGALVTGESVGQVASQTLKAIQCTDAAAEYPVFRPVIGMDKKEIIDIARKIDTFETSTLPYEDCCTVFTPKHPKTRPVFDEVIKAEQSFDFAPLIEKAVEGTTVKLFRIESKEEQE